MDTVVYPDERVDRYLSESLVGFKLCLTERHPDFKEAALGQPVPWAPTFLFTDGKGRAVRRSVGWLSTDGFLDEIKIAQGSAHLQRGRFDDALELLESVAGTSPEAGYYAGVALFLKGNRDMDSLKQRWNTLRTDHPASDWANKASVVDDLG